MSYKLWLFILVGCIARGLSVNAQKTASYLVKGILIDSINQEPIEFATIGILNGENKVVALTYSDENGVFKAADMSAGAYQLSLSFVGYTPKTIPFSVSEASPIADLGTLYLRSEARQLTSVTVIGTQQLVEQQPGMLIYNAEKDISNQGGTAADVLGLRVSSISLPKKANSR